MNGALAIILARAGSKGVPGKNIAPIGGRPCIEWSIDAAAAASNVARVVVSSDDGRALDVARSRGIGAIKRPADLAHDTARIDDAARHALLECERRGMLEVDERTAVVILYANVPVRPAGLVERAVALLTSTGCDSVQSYQPVGKNHPWWTARVDPATGVVAPWEGDVLNHGVFRRQDLPPAFIPDGAVIALTRRALMLEIKGVQPGPHAFFGLDRRGIVNPEGSVVDIDAPIDLMIAHAMLAERTA